MDATIPQDWVTNIGADGERYAYPAPLNQAGFFEDGFDQKPEQTSISWDIVNQKFAKAA